MHNVIDWLRETAAYLASERPDVYDESVAVEELSEAMEKLREEYDKTFAALMFTDFMLCRIYADGDEEFILTRKVSGVGIYADESVAAFSYELGAVDLPHILDDGLDTN